MFNYISKHFETRQKYSTSRRIFSSFFFQKCDQILTITWYICEGYLLSTLHLLCTKQTFFGHLKRYLVKTLKTHKNRKGFIKVLVITHFLALICYLSFSKGYQKVTANIIIRVVPLLEITPRTVTKRLGKRTLMFYSQL